MKSVEVLPSATARGLVLRPTPRSLLWLAILHVLWGAPNLFSDLAEDFVDAIFYLVTGAFYLQMGFWIRQFIQGAAFGALAILYPLTLLHALIVGSNLVDGTPFHGLPLGVFLLGSWSIVDIRQRLKHWDTLKAMYLARRTYVRGWNARAVGWRGLSLVSLVGSVVVVLAFSYATDGWHEANLLTSFALLAMTGTLAIVSNLSDYRSRQHRQRDAINLRANDKRYPIILLRSFADDYVFSESWAHSKSWLPFSWGATRSDSFEEVVVSQLAVHGPVLATGRPGEILPPPGAAREYMSHAEWQSRVTELIDESALIVVYVGTTPGLVWELNEITRRAVENKVLLLLPPLDQGSAANKAHRWQTFQRMLNDSGTRHHRHRQRTASRSRS
jgi:hypothetical protein